MIKSFEISFSLLFYVIFFCSLVTVIDYCYKIQERTEEFLYVHIRTYMDTQYRL